MKLRIEHLANHEAFLIVEEMLSPGHQPGDGPSFYLLIRIGRHVIVIEA